MREYVIIARLTSTQASAPLRQRPGKNFGIPEQNATYDYIVIGGGTGGLAVAYRLAEDGTKTVAAVEAGGYYKIENGNTSVVPAYNQNYNYITPDSRWDAPLVNWGFLTTPQAGAQNQVFHYSRGKMLGGCSAEDAMNYNRPTVGGLQAWTDAVNDTSYAWDEFLPYYESSIDYSNPSMCIRAFNSTVPYIDSANQSGNPLEVSFPNFATPLSSRAQLAFHELGVVDVHDLISGKLIDSQYSPLTLNPKDQSRSSSQTSFLNTAFEGSVYTHTLGQKILFDDNKTTYRVSVQIGPAAAPSYILTGSKEVIVSAGAFQLPQLLIVSGVGPAEILQNHNIPIVADRPCVGQNMWDHVVLSIGHQVSIESYGRLMNYTIAAKAKLEYAINQAGILTNDQSDYLEVEYDISSAPFGTPPFSTPEHPIGVGCFQPVLLTPLSRGNVTISSASMTDPPIISLNCYSHYILSVASPNTTSVQSVNSSHMRTVHASRQMAVVDYKARVIGVNSLRVVDASAFPFLPPGHPQATVFALAEKIATDILAGR
ncbi:GMC oxidoreductase [Macroventuria anomochaeta]|uniref:GMC oxidoreductase n=1 Tax=Macroventuria anomochaeta TaxID=301207 RepID=A0ACB6RKJ3_9PLEO|nr:GMC oxidoreductase [Macroventuria anomochaeta]KAF2621489.1 GMC oxidoreductase [Macroventuria anomochaeta]